MRRFQWFPVAHKEVDSVVQLCRPGNETYHMNECAAAWNSDYMKKWWWYCAKFNTPAVRIKPDGQQSCPQPEACWSNCRTLLVLFHGVILDSGLCLTLLISLSERPQLGDVIPGRQHDRRHPTGTGEPSFPELPGTVWQPYPERAAPADPVSRLHGSTHQWWHLFIFICSVEQWPVQQSRVTGLMG